MNKNRKMLAKISGILLVGESTFYRPVFLLFLKGETTVGVGVEFFSEGLSVLFYPSTKFIPVELETKSSVSYQL